MMRPRTHRPLRLRFCLRATAVALLPGCAFLFLCCVRLPRLHAQAEGGQRIAGRVLNADTGAPLARAEVAIIVVPEGGPEPPRREAPPDRARRGSQRGGGPGNNRRQQVPVAAQSTLSGNDGSFAFNNVAPGKYSLEGSRRGYLTTNYQEHGDYATAIVVAAGQHTEDLALQLSPGATISGTLADASGDPVDQASVSLYRQDQDGLGTIRLYRRARVDDTGAFEFAHLPPGIYFVSGAGRVWFANEAAQAASNADGTANGPHFSPDPATDLDLVYPRTFYADAADSAAATPIPVHGAERLRVDLHLAAVPAVHLVYSQSANAASFRMPQLSQAVFGEAEYSNAAMSTRAARSPQPGGSAGGATSSETSEIGQTVETTVLSVAPGDYDVEVDGRTLQVHASGDLQLDPAAGQSTVALNGRLAAAPGAELPDQLFLTLQGGSARGSQLSAPVGRDGLFHLDSVRPGAYEMEAFGAGRPLAILGAAAAGAEIDGNRLTIGTQAATLALTAAPAAAIVAGFVVDDPPPAGEVGARPTTFPVISPATSPATLPATSPAISPATPPPANPAPGVMIVLVPEHLADHALFRRDQSDSDGSFSLRGCAPGHYTVVAIHDGWDLDWARPSVIRHYLHGGEPVTIPADARGILRLPSPLTAQPR